MLTIFDFVASNFLSNIIKLRMPIISSASIVHDLIMSILIIYITQRIRKLARVTALLIIVYYYD